MSAFHPPRFAQGLTLHLLKQAEVRDRIRRVVRHLLVDEFQDTNPTQVRPPHGPISFIFLPLAGCLMASCCPPQFELLRLLCTGEGAPSLFVVGDPNQSIYSFRGADVSNMSSNLLAHFPETSTLQLRDNYRSLPDIVAMAQRVIDSGTLSRARPRDDPDDLDTWVADDLRPMRAGGRAPQVRGFYSRMQEASRRTAPYSPAGRSASLSLGAMTFVVQCDFVAQHCLGMHRDLGLEWRDLGVLVRTRLQLSSMHQVRQPPRKDHCLVLEGKLPIELRVATIAGLSGAGHSSPGGRRPRSVEEGRGQGHHGLSPPGCQFS